MKTKITIIIVIIIFIIALIFLSMYMNKSENTSNTTSILKVSSNNFEQEVLNSEKIVLVDFYADWCGPCKIFSPILEDISNEYDSVKVVKVNIDDEIELAQHYGVTSVPTLIIIQNGKVVDRSVGAVSKLAIINMIKNITEYG